MPRFAKALEGGAENLTLAIADWIFNESLSADEGKDKKNDFHEVDYYTF